MGVARGGGERGSMVVSEGADAGLYEVNVGWSVGE